MENEEKNDIDEEIFDEDGADDIEESLADSQESDEAADSEDDLDSSEQSESETAESMLTSRFVPGVGNLQPRDLNLEMETSYLDYAMSVIVSRALPDVRDGMKPVHRRVLYAMHATGLTHSVKYRKSAKVVGEVIGNYHPHGDTAAYETLVRMAQDFSMRYPLVDGQGNFGSIDGDGAAAMRYTECRMSSIAGEMLLDIDKDTVDWQDNYDGTTQEPIVLPSRVPNLLMNGTMGIAVGMATNIPPHNLNELCNGINALIDDPDITVDGLMEHVKGPDFPTAGIIYNNEDIKMAYATGKGRIVMRAKAAIEDSKRGFKIVVTEIPYQVNKATLVEKIAELVKTKRIDGISDLRDESDRRGMRIVIELKANSYPKKILNQLYELTQMQTAFHLNMLALTPDLEPRVMTLKDILGYYIEHRKEVIERRTRYELKKAQDRAHILEGLKIALDNIDEVINLIRSSANRESAKANLIEKFELSEKQADAILDMRLSALAALERQKIEDEYNDLLQKIAYYEDILAHPEKILGLIKEDLKEVSEKYGDARKTTIVPTPLNGFSAEDLIPDEKVIVTLTRGNYIKRQEVASYKKQTRGGVGIVGMSTKEEDIVDYLACVSTHDDIYFFSNKGRVFKSKVYELPSSSRQSKGTSIVNIIQIAQGEKVTAILTVPKGDNNNKFFVMGTENGQIKKTEIDKYDNIRKTGIIAIGLKGNDELKWVKTSAGNDVIVEVTEKGQAICYLETDVRPMGRSASGVGGIKMRSNDKVMAMDVVPISLSGMEGSNSSQRGADMLVVLENGFGKRTMLKNFHLQKRGGMGIRAANCTPKTGNIIGMHITYNDLPDVILASQKGQFIRMELAKIKRLGRDTQGVTLMRLRPGDKVSSVALIEPEEPENGDQTQITFDDNPDSSPTKKTNKSADRKKETPECPAVETKEVAKKEKIVEQKEIKVKTYNRDDDEASVKTKPHNPPIVLDDVNYWGKNN